MQATPASTNRPQATTNLQQNRLQKVRRSKHPQTKTNKSTTITAQNTIIDFNTIRKKSWRFSHPFQEPLPRYQLSFFRFLPDSQTISMPKALNRSSGLINTTPSHCTKDAKRQCKNRWTKFSHAKPHNKMLESDSCNNLGFTILASVRILSHKSCQLKAHTLDGAALFHIFWKI